MRVTFDQRVLDVVKHRPGTVSEIKERMYAMHEGTIQSSLNRLIEKCEVIELEGVFHATAKPLDALVYDCETLRPRVPANGYKVKGIEYVDGWDLAKMGISVIGVYDYVTDKFLHFLEADFPAFQKLVSEREHVIGFNSISFDDELCRANGIEVTTTYDILCEVRAATGQPRDFVKGKMISGYGLGELARSNFGEAKTGEGVNAPLLWQQGRHGQVIDYCLHDVELTKRIFDARGSLIDPVTGETLRLLDL